MNEERIELSELLASDAGFALEGWTNKLFCITNRDQRLVQPISTSEAKELLSAEQGKRPGYNLHPYPLRKTVQLAVTGRCNYHCVHCLAASDASNLSSQLTLEECEKIFDDMLECCIYDLWITGGEPFVHPQLIDIIAAATRRDLRISRIYTNGALVTRELLEEISAQGQRPGFVVSFDGLGTHDWMRDCPGAEERTLEAIKLMQGLGFDVSPSINVNSVTAPNLIETVRMFALEFGCERIRPIYTSPTPRWDEFCPADKRLDIGDYYDLMIGLLRISRVEKWPAYIEIIHMPSLHGPGSEADTELLRNPPVVSLSNPIMSMCGKACSVVFIGSDGRVLPCSTYEGESTMLGTFQGEDVSIKSRSLAEILADSEYADEFKLTLKYVCEVRPECADCKRLSICRGGCPLYTHALRFDDIGNPICKFHSGGYVEKYLAMLEETS